MPTTTINPAPRTLGRYVMRRSMVVVTAVRPRVSNAETRNVSINSQKRTLAESSEGDLEMPALLRVSATPIRSEVRSSPTRCSALLDTISTTFAMHQPTVRITIIPTRLGRNPASVRPSSVTDETITSRHASGLKVWFMIGPPCAPVGAQLRTAYTVGAALSTSGRRCGNALVEGRKAP